MVILNRRGDVKTMAREAKLNDSARGPLVNTFLDRGKLLGTLASDSDPVQFAPRFAVIMDRKVHYAAVIPNNDVS